MIQTISSPTNRIKSKTSTHFNDNDSLTRLTTREVTRFKMVDTINDTQSFNSFDESKLLDNPINDPTVKSRLSMATSGGSSNDDLIEILSSLSALKSTALVIASTSDHDDFSDKLDHLIGRISHVEDELIDEQESSSTPSSATCACQLSEIADSLTEICVSARVQSLLPLLEPFIKTLRRLSSA